MILDKLIRITKPFYDHHHRSGLAIPFVEHETVQHYWIDPNSICIPSFLSAARAGWEEQPNPQIRQSAEATVVAVTNFLRSTSI
jgi:hypothetical protein